MDTIEDLLEVAEKATGILTEATFETEVDSFTISLNTELDAFANRKLSEIASEIKESFEKSFTNTFMINSKRLIERLQYMTHNQRADLYGRVELGVKKHVISRFPGRNEVETHELAHRISNSTILELKMRIEGADKHLEQKEY